MLIKSFQEVGGSEGSGELKKNSWINVDKIKVGGSEGSLK